MGANCKGVMGRGIAKQFKERSGQMYQTYKLQCQKKQFRTGDVYAYHHGKGYVFNLGAQASWTTKATPEAVETSLKNMLLFAKKDIALSKIGAGLGGLPCEEAKTVLRSVSERHPGVTLWVVEHYKA